MPHNTSSFLEAFERGRREARERRRADTPLNHGQPWDMNQEEILLRMFAQGSSIAQIATTAGRTHGAITSRIRQILHDPYWRIPLGPGHRREAANIYERRYGMPLPRSSVGQPSLAERQAQSRIARTVFPNLETLRYVDPVPTLQPWPDPSYFADYVAPPPQAVDVEVASLTASALQDTLERTRTRVREAMARVRNRNPSTEYDRHGRPRRVETAPEVPETPPHLEAAVPLTKKHFDAMAREIRALRPTQEGRAAAAQHSTLNKLAYKLAPLFEGENSSFDRARWLQACGVQTTQRS